MRQTLMILGIVLLAIAIAVVYFERKLREQNHKIASMFSLVSSLAEEVNSLKYKEHEQIEVIHIGNQLIDVSDDELEVIEEEEDEDEDEEEDEEEEEEEELSEASELDLEELDEESITSEAVESASEAELEEEEIKIKVLKIDKPDFKKMNISELRSIATSKGMDAAKLKKSELIELLSN